MTRTPTYTPAFIRGWNAAMSHAEDTLVNLSLSSASDPRAATEVARILARHSGMVLMAAADAVGKNRQPTKRHYG